MEIRLAAIYNVWDDEHLERSMRSLKGNVDLFVIVYQSISNFGELYNPFKKMPSYLDRMGHVIVRYFTPTITTDPMSAHKNELNKRQIGIEIARSQDCTHFLHLDCDEIHPEFKEAKQDYINNGSDCSLLTYHEYIGHDTYRITPELKRVVPFICELKDNLIMGEGTMRGDKTRICQSVNVVQLAQKMHHLSWVRQDIGRKVRNSSARDRRPSVERIVEDYKYLTSEDHVAQGYELKGFGGRYVDVKRFDEN